MQAMKEAEIVKTLKRHTFRKYIESGHREIKISMKVRESGTKEPLEQPE